MKPFRKLPLGVRIATPVLLLVVVGLVAWKAAFTQPDPVVVLETRDFNVFETAKLVLEMNDILLEESTSAGSYSLVVPPEGDAAAAAAVLERSGVKDRTMRGDEQDACPSAPGFTGARIADERVANCEAAREIQAMLLTAGADAANVQVSQDSGAAPEDRASSTNVVAQVFLPPNLERRWDAAQVARAISRSLGTTIDRVSIVDAKLQTMFDGSTR